MTGVTFLIPSTLTLPLNLKAELRSSKTLWVSLPGMGTAPPWEPLPHLREDQHGMQSFCPETDGPNMTGVTFLIPSTLTWSHDAAYGRWRPLWSASMVEYGI